MPIVGNYLVEEESGVRRENVFLLYTHMRFWLSLMIISPAIILIDDLIEVWLGAKYILPSIITYLFAAEFYIDLVHSASVDYINGMGLFKMDKYIELAGAVSNIVFSILFVHLFGLAGVIAGTVLSQCLFWAGRSTIVYFKGMCLRGKHFLIYWLRNIYYVFVFVVCTWLCGLLYSRIETEASVIKILTGGVLCELCIAAIGMVMLFNLREQKKMLDIAVGLMRKAYKRMKKK